MAIVNSNVAYTGLVEKYVGTAYDKMALLSDNIEALLLIANEITEGTFGDILDIADDISRVVDDIEGFNGIYWGAINTSDPDVILEDPTAPLADQHPKYDSNGDTANDGDLYFNVLREDMYVRNNGIWVGTGTIERKVERHVVTPAQEADNLTQDIIISLNSPYVMGSNNLFVFKDGILLSSESVEPITGDYREQSITQVLFPMPTATNDLIGLKAGEELTFAINSDVATLKQIVDIDQHILPGGPGKSVYFLPENVTYIPGDHNIEVYLGSNRILQIPGVDYTETAPDRITFFSPKENEDVIINIGHIISTTPSRGATLFQDTKPDELLYEQGQQWFDTGKARMFILYDDGIDSDGVGHSKQWVSFSAEEDVLVQGGGPIVPEIPPVEQVRETIMQEEQPDPDVFNKGALWFQTSTGKLFILYDDANDEGIPGTDKHWVRVST